MNKLKIIEDLESKRKTYLLGFIVFFGMWQFPWIIIMYFRDYLPKVIVAVFMIALLVGTVGWVWVTILLMKISKVFKQNPELIKVLNDERIFDLRYKASYYGMLTTMIVSMFFYLLIYLAKTWFGLDLNLFSGQFVAHMLWFVIVMSSTISFYVLEKNQ